MAKTLKAILAGFNARVELVAPGVCHVHTSRGQLEHVRETVLAHLPGVENVLAYDDFTLGVFMPGAAR